MVGKEINAHTHILSRNCMSPQPVQRNSSGKKERREHKSASDKQL